MLSRLYKLFNFLNPFKEEPVDELTAEVIFAGNKDDDLDPDDYCKNCDCDIKFLEEFDASKKIILLIDDNPGIVSFLKDDMEYLIDKNIMDNNLNILCASGSHSAFCLEKFLEENDITINYVIIDITFGGSIIKNHSIVKYTGIDVFDMCHKNNPDLKYMFYTGNKLNTYIKSNKNLIEQFKDIMNKELKDFVLFKTSLGTQERRNFIAKAFT